MKRIALISFGVGKGGFSQFGEFLLNATVALYYLDEILRRAGFEVLIVDQPNLEVSAEEIFNKLIKFKPQAILFSQFFTTRNQVRSLIEKIKLSGMNCVFGVGGHDATFHSLASPKSYKMFDLVFQGPVLGNIVECLNSQHKPLFINTLGKTEDPNSLPVISHSRYQGEVGFLKTSEGCLKSGRGCGFCTTPQFCPSGYRLRRREAVLEEIKNLKRAGKKFVFVSDDNFLGFSSKHLRRGHEIIMACKEVGLQVMIMTRPERIVAASEKGFLSDWRQTVYRIFVGVENGSVGGLKQLQKSAPTNYIEISRKAVCLLKENNIAPFLGYINFTGPRTGLNNLEQSARFIHSLEEADMTALSQNLRPYEGTAVFDEFNGLSLKINKSEVVYRFSDKRVTRLYRSLLWLRNITDEMDNFVYTLTDYVSIFELPVNLVADFTSTKQTWNDLVFNHFIDMLCACRKGREKDSVDFIASTRELILKSKILLSKISRLQK